MSDLPAQSVSTRKKDVNFWKNVAPLLVPFDHPVFNMTNADIKNTTKSGCILSTVRAKTNMNKHVTSLNLRHGKSTQTFNHETSLNLRHDKSTETFNHEMSLNLRHGKSTQTLKHVTSLNLRHDQSTQTLNHEMSLNLQHDKSIQTLKHVTSLNLRHDQSTQTLTDTPLGKRESSTQTRSEYAHRDGKELESNNKSGVSFQTSGNLSGRQGLSSDIKSGPEIRQCNSEFPKLYGSEDLKNIKPCCVLLQRLDLVEKNAEYCPEQVVSVMNKSETNIDTNVPENLNCGINKELDLETIPFIPEKSNSNARNPKRMRKNEPGDHEKLKLYPRVYLRRVEDHVDFLSLFELRPNFKNRNIFKTPQKQKQIRKLRKYNL